MLRREGHCAQQALNLKEGPHSAGTTPLLVSLLEQQRQRQQQRQRLSIGHESAGDLELDDDPLRSLPSERQLQSSSSFRDESVEFDELEAELAQTKSRSAPAPAQTPPPNVSAAEMNKAASSPQKSSPTRDVAFNAHHSPSKTLSPLKQPHLSSLGGWARLMNASHLCSLFSHAPLSSLVLKKRI